MNDRSVTEIADRYGLTVEQVEAAEAPAAFKIFKGVNTIFTGDEAAARQFLSEYEKTRPGLYEGRTVGYKE